MNDSSVELIIMTRAPVAGKTKTRLIPLLGGEGAALLHTHLLDTLLTRLCKNTRVKITLCCTPDTSHPFFKRCQDEYGVVLRNQVGSDLGERMYNALHQSLTHHDYAIVIGSDILELTSEDIIVAIHSLESGMDAVINPAVDGGYVLLGLSQINVSIFEGVSWGSSCVMKQTVNRLQEAGWKWRELRTLWDIDRPDDLKRISVDDLPEAVRTKVMQAS